MAEDAFVTDFEHIMADDITENVRFIMYDSESGKTASAGEVSKYMMKNVHVDTTLTEEGSAADAKAVGGALAKKADTKGRYEDIVAGGAEQLMADGYETDKDPYLFRPTGGSADVGNREYLDKIVGGTVAWNQLVDPSYIRETKTINGITFTNNADGTVTINGTLTESQTGAWQLVKANVAFVENHVYAYLTSQNTFVSYCNIDGTSYNKSNSIFKATASATRDCYLMIPNGVQYTNVVVKPQIFDLTAMFGSTIADYIYSLEQSQAGAGVAWFRQYFPKDYYPYDAGTLKSVQTSAHKTYDADGNVIGTYPLDGSLTLRGVTKLVDGKLEFDGDIYPPSGEVQRRYGIVDLGTLDWAYDGDEMFKVNSVYEMKFIGYGICTKYQVVQVASWRNVGDKQISVTNSQANPILRIHDSTAGTDATAFKTAMSGVYLVYEKATPTTETADGYEHYQMCDPSGTEEFVTTGIVPVSHETRYPHDLKKKIETAPDSPSADGTYLMKRSGGKNTYMALPSTPSANGSYVLTVTVNGGSASYSWTAKE